jgi:hypothetical protein
MVRIALPLALVVLAAPSFAQLPQRGPGAPAQPQVAPAAQPAPAPAAPAPAPKGPRELEQAKKLGRQGLVKLAPKLGGRRVEQLAKDRGGAVVDQAIDLAAEKAGVKK